jgi:phosphatidylserine/phosphatidylglycerophosphate/cardiolipin synthase-like enzyme
MLSSFVEKVGNECRSDRKPSRTPPHWQRWGILFYNLFTEFAKLWACKGQGRGTRVGAMKTYVLACSPITKLDGIASPEWIAIHNDLARIVEARDALIRCGAFGVKIREINNGKLSGPMTIDLNGNLVPVCPAEPFPSAVSVALDKM